MMKYDIPLFKVRIVPQAVMMEQLEDTLYSGYIAEGEKVKEFEQAFGTFIGNENVFATNSCTNGLYIALKMLGLKPGKNVVMSPMTCVATAAPVGMLGGSIRWADCHPDLGLIDPNSARKAVDENTVAIVAMHWGGDLCDMETLSGIADFYDIGLIDDAAQALGGVYPRGIKIGSNEIISYADFTCFSFQAIKHITTGDGGMVACMDKETRDRGKRLSWFGIDKQAFRLPSGDINNASDIPELGYKMHMNDLTASIGLAQLEWFGEDLWVYQSNREALKREIEKVVDVPRLNGCSAAWVMTICCDRRNELMEHLCSNGIHASLMHTRIDGYTGIDGVAPNPLTGIDSFSNRHLCIPCGPWVNEGSLMKIGRLIREFYD